MTIRRHLHKLHLATALLLATAGIASALPCARAQAIAPPAPEKAPTPYAPINPADIPHIDFDVATFKINRSGAAEMPYIQIPADGDGFTAQNRPMHDLIRYGFSRGRGGAYRISGQPSWVEDDRYDIQAKVAPEDIAKWKALSPSVKRLAFQGFLIEYLKLKYHQDDTEHEYYALTVGKNGPKLKTSVSGATYKDANGQPVAARTLLWTSPSDITAYACEMERFADMLTAFSDRVILDRTGLTGYYDFTLHFDGASNSANPDGPEMPFRMLRPDAATPSVFSAVKEIGLEIKPAKGPLDGMVIDHIERPPED